MPTRCMPTAFSPASSARAPTAVQYGGTSMVTPVSPETKARRPMRQNWWAAARPLKCTCSSSVTCPASATEFAMMAPSPTRQSWPTWLYAMKRQPLPMTVSPPPCTVPRLMVTHSRKVLRSPITRRVGSPRYLRSCGISPITAWEKTRFPAPSVVCPFTMAWAATEVPGPSTTSDPTTANGPTSQVGSTRAPDSTTAVGWMAISRLRSLYCSRSASIARNSASATVCPSTTAVPFCRQIAALRFTTSTCSSRRSPGTTGRRNFAPSIDMR